MLSKKRHKKRCYKHAARRAKERYKMTLSYAAYKLLNKKIVNGEAEYVRPEVGNRRVYVVPWGKKEKLVVIYDPRLECIVTLLPRDSDKHRPVGGSWVVYKGMNIRIRGGK